MKLFFAQLEENREPYIDLFGDVCDEVIAWFMFLSAKRFITKKNFTMQDALDQMVDQFDSMNCVLADVQIFNRHIEKIMAYFTKPRWSKPADVVIHDLIVDRPRNGLIVKWDYTDGWKARQQKKADRERHKIVSDWEKKCGVKR